MGRDTQGEPSYRDDRYHLIADSGSLYYDPATGEGADGFQTPEAAAEWAKRQATWPELSELLADGLSAIIALGAELNANNEAWDEWDGEGAWPGVPRVQNWAIGLGLVIHLEP